MGPSTSDRPHPPLYGVLGGIASGKSTVARRLAGEDGVLLCADDMAREALERPDVQERLVAAFGPAAVGADGRTDRAFLAGRVFSSATERRRLEGWIHPLVRARILAGLEEAARQGARRVVLDVPLLLENDEQHGLASLCDWLVFVEVGSEERDRRAVASRGWEPGEVARREAAQTPLDRKRARADFVVSNEGTLEELDEAIAAVLADAEGR